MKLVISITLLIISLAFAILVERRIKAGKMKRVETYSFKPVIKRSLLHSCVAIVILFVVYFHSKSLEITITLGVFFLLCIVGACLFGLLLEHQTKRKGGRRAD